MHKGRTSVQECWGMYLWTSTCVWHQCICFSINVLLCLLRTLSFGYYLPINSSLICLLCRCSSTPVNASIRNCHHSFSDRGSHHLRDPRTHKWWDCWNEEFHSLLLTFVHFCPLVCWFHKWRNDVLVCILPLYVLTTVNVILLTILPDCNPSTK